MKILHKHCDKSLSKDKTLPRNSYLIKYLLEEEVKYDIVQAGSRVEIFDFYYDTYGKGSLMDISWTEGTINPRLYGIQSSEDKKRSKK